MQNEVMFAGFGGQGILLIGNILAHAAMEQGSEVAWVPSYGPEMRGGTAYCLVVISDRPIGSPIIRHPMHLIAMNRPSLEKFAHMVKPKGIVVINSSLISIRAGLDDVDELLVTANADRVRITHKPEEAVQGADLVETDVWASMGQESEQQKRAKLFAPYQVNSELMSLAASDALYMHCLPAHRGEEISAELMDAPDTVIWDEAENRLHAQKALIETLLLARR